MDFWAENFQITEEFAELESRSSICEFCRLRRDLCKRLHRDHESIHFDRLESTLRLNENHPPVFTIYTGRGMYIRHLISRDQMMDDG